MTIHPLASTSRLSSASAPPGLAAARPVAAEPAAPEDRVQIEAPVQPEPAPANGHHLVRRLMAGAALAFVATGALAGAAIHVAATAPVCGASPVSISREGVCVSPEIGVKGTNISRTLQIPRYFEQSATDLSSGRSRLVVPEEGAVPPQALQASGDLRVVTWNLHHGTTPIPREPETQWTNQVASLRQHPADVYLLQEVVPWQVDEVVDAMGMPGYYSTANPMGGGLMLVHPDLQVTANQARMVGGEAPALGDRAAARRILVDWMKGGGSESPRVAQVLEVQLPDGQEVTLWNAHLAGRFHPEDNRVQMRDLLALIAEQAGPDGTVVGGGDFNAERDSESLETLKADGYAADGMGIDWISARGAGVEAAGEWQGAPGSPQSVQEGTMPEAVGADSVTSLLSDHPLVDARIQLQAG